MTYVLLVLMSVAGASVPPQTRWLCAALLGQPTTLTLELDRAKYEAPLHLLHAARASSRELPAAATYREKIRRHFVAHAAALETTRNVVIDDVHDAGAGLAPELKIHRHHLIRRASARIFELLRGPNANFIKTRVVSGRDQIANFLGEALTGAAAADAAHAADVSARRVAAIRAFANNLPISRPLSTGAKLAVTVGASAAMALGTAATLPPHFAYGASLAGVLGWFGFQDRVFEAVSRLRWRVEYWWFSRRRRHINDGFDESLVARSTAHVHALERLIAAAQSPAKDALTFYAFDAELPLKRGEDQTLDIETIRAGARGPAVPFRETRWARIELLLVARNGVPTLMMFASEIPNPSNVMMNTYMSSLDPARFPLGFQIRP